MTYKTKRITFANFIAHGLAIASVCITCCHYIPNDWSIGNFFTNILLVGTISLIWSIVYNKSIMMSNEIDLLHFTIEEKNANLQLDEYADLLSGSLVVSKNRTKDIAKAVSDWENDRRKLFFRYLEDFQKSRP